MSDDKGMTGRMACFGKELAVKKKMPRSFGKASRVLEAVCIEALFQKPYLLLLETYIFIRNKKFKRYKKCTLGLSILIQLYCLRKSLSFQRNSKSYLLIPLLF